MPILCFIIAFWAVLCGVSQAQDATSPLLGMLMMGRGLHMNDWGAQTNANLTKIENAIAGDAIISATGGTLTLTSAQANSSMIILNGTLTANQIIVFPSVASGRIHWIGNFTGGAYSVTIQSSAGGGGATVSVPQGAPTPIYVDNSNAVVNANPAVPVGTIWHFAGPTAPANWHFCDGTAMPVANYPALNAAIGGYYGSGSGTINLPDARGRVLAGPDGGTGRLYGWTLGAAAGEAAHTLTTTEMPSHNHSGGDTGHTHTATDSGHTHSFDAFQNVTGPNVGVSAPAWGYTTRTTAVGYANITVATGYANVVVGYSGGGAAHNVVQPTLVTNCIIRVQ